MPKWSVYNLFAEVFHMNAVCDFSEMYNCIEILEYEGLLEYHTQSTHKTKHPQILNL